MATYTPTMLAFGQLPNSPGDLCAPSGVKWLVHNLVLHNINTTTETVVLNYYDGANTYVWLNVALRANETITMSFPNDGFIIEDGDKITGSTTTVSKVTYKFDGTIRA